MGRSESALKSPFAVHESLQYLPVKIIQLHANARLKDAFILGLIPSVKGKTRADSRTRPRGCVRKNLMVFQSRKGKGWGLGFIDEEGRGGSVVRRRRWRVVDRKKVTARRAVRRVLVDADEGRSWRNGFPILPNVLLNMWCHLNDQKSRRLADSSGESNIGGHDERVAAPDMTKIVVMTV